MAAMTSCAYALVPSKNKGMLVVSLVKYTLQITFVTVKSCFLQYEGAIYLGENSFL